MNIFNLAVPKDSISMVFDPFSGLENYKTTLYMYKTKIELVDKDNDATAYIALDLNSKKHKMIQRIFNVKYGTYLLTFLNADFSSAESAYNTFFAYYGLEGFNDIEDFSKKYATEYMARYTSVKNFLDYYNKAFEFVRTDYIKFQKNLCQTVDFVFNLHNNKESLNVDKYSKFLAYSSAVDLLGQSSKLITLSMVNGLSDKISPTMSAKEIEKLAQDISNKKINDVIGYVYESKSHFTLAYIALTDLLQNFNKNISVCKNCGRYFIQYSGKEIYCELNNVDGSPTCKSYASRKAYDIKVEQDIAELTYKREYQKRITRLYRANDLIKVKVRSDFEKWRIKAKNQLSLYRDGKITSEEFCKWIENYK